MCEMFPAVPEVNPKLPGTMAAEEELKWDEKMGEK